MGGSSTLLVDAARPPPACLPSLPAFSLRPLSPHVSSLEVLRSCINDTEAHRLFADSPARLPVRNASAPILLQLPPAVVESGAAAGLLGPCGGAR